MPPSNLFFVLCRPDSESDPVWQRFQKGENLEKLVKSDICKTGAVYRRITNPMGRQPPDDMTFLALYSTDGQHGKDFKDMLPGDETSTAIEIRNYEMLEVFEPKGPATGPAPLILEAEADLDDIEEFKDFYRVDHAPLMSKHPGYRRTTLYGFKPDPKIHHPTPPAPILIIHEFSSFEGLGGPITKATTETQLAKKVFGSVKSMKARTLSLESSAGY